jgi:hypothetical protein
MPAPSTAKEAMAQIAAIVARYGAGELDVESMHALTEGLKAFVSAFAIAELEIEVEKARSLEET